MSAAVPWIVGAVVLIVGGIVAARAAGRRSTAAVTVDRARSLLSELDLALDQAGDLPADTLAEARRLQLLAGGCLAGDPNAADARRSAHFSARALAILTAPQR